MLLLQAMICLNQQCIMMSTGFLPAATLSGITGGSGTSHLEWPLAKYWRLELRAEDRSIACFLKKSGCPQLLLTFASNPFSSMNLSPSPSL
jgi:hypothetical protein